MGRKGELIKFAQWKQSVKRRIRLHRLSKTLPITKIHSRSTCLPVSVAHRLGRSSFNRANMYRFVQPSTLLENESSFRFQPLNYFHTSRCSRIKINSSSSSSSSSNRKYLYNIRN